MNLTVAGEWRKKYGFEKHLGIRVGATFDWYDVAIRVCVARINPRFGLGVKSDV